MNSTQYARALHPRSADAEYCPITVFVRNIFTHCRTGKKDADLKVVDNITAVKSELKQLNTNTPKELRFEHLAAAEQSLPDVAFRYAVLHKDNLPVMFVYFQVFTLTSRNFNLHKDKSFIKNILRLFLHLKKAKVLVLGNALRTESHSCCYDTVRLTKTDVQNALAVVAEQIATEDQITAVILPGMQPQGAQHTRKITSMGYSTPWEDNVMNMEINPGWKTLQDYTDSLTRKYKARANKMLASAAQLETRQLDASDMQRHRADIKRLFAQVVDKQPFAFTTSGAEYVMAMKELYGDEFEVLGYFLNGKLVAFCSAFVTDGIYELFYVGYDTKVNEDTPLYFNMLLSGLERAILLGKRELKLGRTSFDAKASLGAKPVTNDYFIKFRNLPDVAVKWFANYFSAIEDNKWKLRNPLKA